MTPQGQFVSGRAARTARYDRLVRLVVIGVFMALGAAAGVLLP
jgi:hypothetical protein